MEHTIVRFIWFLYMSWRYLKGQRLQSIKSFIPAWRTFNSLVKEDLC